MTINRDNKVRKPIRKTVLIAGLIFFLLLSTVLQIMSYLFVSSSLTENYNARMNDILTYIENNTDTDDLKECIRTGTTSEKYDQLQHMLNRMVDDFELAYLYIAIPEEDVMVNVCSATSEAERAAGETDLPILFETDAYSKEELELFRSLAELDKVSYVEESSDYGTFYTACKPLYDSKGEKICLACVDLSVDDMHATIRRFMYLSLLVISLVGGLCTLIALTWIRKNITMPVLALEKSSRDLIDKVKNTEDLKTVDFEIDRFDTGNEIESLANTIREMTIDMKQYSEDMLKAQEKIQKAEKEAKDAAKIAELQNSLSSLLINMPGLSFSKDAKTGEYLACNQAFAEYAHKNNPEEVAGLTDYDIFDPVTAQHFVEDDRIALSMDEPYVFFEDVFDAAGNPKQFQTTKQKYIDSLGRLCTLGLCVDVTEMEEIKRENIETRSAYDKAVNESVTYGHIASTLIEDYAELFYIDLENCRYIEYYKDEDNDKGLVETKGENIFEDFHAFARDNFDPKDQETFIKTFTRENVIRSLDEDQSFALTYRMLKNDVPIYYHLKAIPMKDDRRHIIMAVNDIDMQVKQQEAIDRVMMERTTYARISALSGDFICIYVIDPDTDHFIEYGAVKGYEDRGLSKEGDDFFGTVRENIEGNIHPDDMQRFDSLFNKDTILNEIEKNGIFSMRYRIMIKGIAKFVMMKASTVTEDNKLKLIIGINDIDAHVRQEEEYQFKLSQAQRRANVDALTGVKNKHAYIDLENRLNRQIESGEDVRFAILVFDVNDLKEINDSEGHQAGDRYIRDACMIICRIFKHSPVFRVGGDEFVVVAQDSDYDDLDNLLDQLKESNDKNAESNGVVIACGMSRFNADRKVETVFARADRQMYVNKHDLKVLIS